MKQLFITDIINPTIFDDYLGQDTRIALKSISIRATWFNLGNDNDFTIRTATSNDLITRIWIVKGLYKIEDLAAIINKQANGLYDCLFNGKKSKIIAILPTKELDKWGDIDDEVTKQLAVVI